MTRPVEPCLCGDPECRRCFPIADEAYAAAMEKLNLPDDVPDWEPLDS